MNRAEKRRHKKFAQKAASNAKLGKATIPPPDQQTLTIQQSLELAAQYHKAGDLPQAGDIYQQVLQADPNQPDALHLLGLIAYQGGKNDIAVGFITKALAIKPDIVGAHSNLGLALQDLRRLDEAVASYNKAIAIKPELAEAHYNLGNALKQRGKLDEAVASFHKALAIKPDYADAHSNLGNALQELEKFEDAIASYHKALAIKPELAEAHSNLGIALQELGKLEDAFTCHRRAVTLNPQNDSFWTGLTASLETLSFTSVDDDLWQDLLQLLEQPMVRPSHVIRPVISALRHHPDFSQILELTSSGKPEIGIAYGDVAERLSAIPLFLRIMGLSFISDLEIERMLTFLRHTLLKETLAGKTDEKGIHFQWPWPSIVLPTSISFLKPTRKGRRRAASATDCDAGGKGNRTCRPPSLPR